MYLENISLDARDAGLVGRFWEALLGCTPLLDEPDAYETRLTVPDGPVLDVCVQRVPEPTSPDTRGSTSTSAGGARQTEVVERALALGARHLDIGQRGVPWVVLADPEGNPFCVMEERPEYAASGPIAALPLDSADPERDAAFWAELSGWEPVDSAMPAALRHPSGSGPAPRALSPNRGPRGRRRTGSTSTSASRPATTRMPCSPASSSCGGRELHPDWGDLPWRVVADPSGNELCLLPARTP